MIPHNYKNASDDPAQWVADQCGRQEVTPSWYEEYGIDRDLPFYLWKRKLSDESYKFGLDPWIIGEDFGYQYRLIIGCSYKSVILLTMGLSEKNQNRCG